MSFFTELKRRNVFKVCVTYAVLAWVLMQVADIVLPTFDAPRWVLQVFIFFLIVGLPLSLIVSWAFEFTSDGLKLTSEVDAEASTRTQTSKKLNYLIIASLALSLGFVIIDQYILEDAQGVAATPDMPVPAQTPVVAEVVGPAIAAPALIEVAPDEKSIAVLPFTNLSAEADQEYFADGLTEEMIDSLSRVEGLLVTGRTSAFFFKNSQEKLDVIAATLGVRNILQGSVRKSGNRLRISVQLMNAVNGFNLWSNSYDRELDDIFAIQDEIAEAVTEALSVSLGAGAFDKPGMTRNVAAYDEWLRGGAALDEVTPQSALAAVNHLEKASSLDPDAALVWLRLGSAYQLALVMVPPAQTQGFQQNLEDARIRAVRLEPNILEVELLAARNLHDAGNWLESERIYGQLLNQYGNSQFEVNLDYGRHLVDVGRLQDALIYLKRAHRQEPLLIATNFGLAETLTSLPQYEDETRQEIAWALEQGLSAPQFNGELAWLEIQNKNWEAARAATRNMVTTREMQLAAIDLVEQGRHAEGLALVRELRADGDMPPILRAKHLPAYAAMFGDPHLALEIFGETERIRTIWRPTFSDMRKLPEFKQFMADLGLVEYWRTTGEWPDLCRPVGDDFECE